MSWKGIWKIFYFWIVMDILFVICYLYGVCLCITMELEFNGDDGVFDRRDLFVVVYG